jgi:hypothetical protein
MVGGPAHHRISSENACFYGNNPNSRIAVTQDVTQAMTSAVSGEIQVKISSITNGFDLSDVSASQAE